MDVEHSIAVCRGAAAEMASPSMQVRALLRHKHRNQYSHVRYLSLTFYFGPIGRVFISKTADGWAIGCCMRSSVVVLVLVVFRRHRPTSDSSALGSAVADANVDSCGEYKDGQWSGQFCQSASSATKKAARVDVQKDLFKLPWQNLCQEHHTTGCTIQ